MEYDFDYATAAIIVNLYPPSYTIKEISDLKYGERLFMIAAKSYQKKIEKNAIKSSSPLISSRRPSVNKKANI